MPDIDVSSGSTEKVLNDEQARAIDDPDDPRTHAIVDVSSDAVRLVSGRDKEQARHGLPVAAGTTITGFTPNANTIYAYGDGSGTATVHVHLVGPETFDIREVSL